MVWVEWQHSFCHAFACPHDLHSCGKVPLLLSMHLPYALSPGTQHACEALWLCRSWSMDLAPAFPYVWQHFFSGVRPFLTAERPLVPWALCLGQVSSAHIHLCSLINVVHSCRSLQRSIVKIVFVESIARVQTLSLSGKILYHLRLADLILVQWPVLQHKYPRTQFCGRLL